MKPDAPDPKTLLRRKLREKRRQQPLAERARDSERIRETLLEQTVWQQARTVLLFVPVDDEPDVWPLVADALRSGKAVALPRHDAASDQYHAAQIANPAADLRPGRWGILEPRPECPEVPLNRLDFALVPGVGFTLDGGRLGRGKGYFDRLLSAVPGFKCGVAYDGQVVSELPLEPHDVRLNCILTPTRWHQTAGRGRF